MTGLEEMTMKIKKHLQELDHEAYAENIMRGYDDKRPVPTLLLKIGFVLTDVKAKVAGRVICPLIGHREEVEDSHTGRVDVGCSRCHQYLGGGYLF